MLCNDERVIGVFVYAITHLRTHANTHTHTHTHTHTQIDSQNPYMAMFVGEPYVYTIDAENLTEVEQTLQRIVELPVSI